MTKPYHDEAASLTPGPDRILWGRSGMRWLWADRCLACQGRGNRRHTSPSGRMRYGKELNQHKHTECDKCLGAGWVGINALLPTIAPPGSAEKQVVIQVRYHAGAPAFHSQDADRESFDLSKRGVIPYMWTPLFHAEYNLPSYSDPLLTGDDLTDDL